ncbi:MAG: hypothetical protein HGJ94_17230 [Desulfosarcina sp.]|nr:hypothetical protein [Desulfosarcina sp.]MBC2742116.1 hypothetical protein [Desulfosarcina sp.]MBC2765029.1 hypothetical protein [Desulfosarcina sp.]
MQHVERVPISGILDDHDPDRITVRVAATGLPLRLRRDLVEFAPGAVVMPAWLWARIFKGDMGTRDRLPIQTPIKKEKRWNTQTK